MKLKIFEGLSCDAIRDLMEIKLTRQRAVIWAALILTFGEYAGCVALMFHGDYFSLYLVVAYAARETRGGENYQALLISLLSAIRHPERRQMVRAWIKGDRS